MSDGSGVAEHGRRRIDEIGEESRRRILDAAEELFAERGFERTSFVDIAERSGISRGSIPWHFRNKDGLLMAVLVRAMDRFLPPERYRRALPSLATLLLDYESWARSGNSALIFMVLTEAMRSTGPVRGQYQEFFDARRRRVVRWLCAQRPAGTRGGADNRERATAVALNGAVMGIHLQSLIDPDVDLDAALQSLATLVDGD
ncbi:helix-turn-helix domain-containing protein [Amycolatopsis dongchuanensis]|uniref:HTH tetR-type domain-containing protein n=1 Tax=Amycolatopsis dongchuanensis TaxID=1070866 RepID=A0ABP9PXY2_9PSEU